VLDNIEARLEEVQRPCLKSPPLNASEIESSWKEKGFTGCQKESVLMSGRKFSAVNV